MSESLKPSGHYDDAERDHALRLSAEVASLKAECDEARAALSVAREALERCKEWLPPGTHVEDPDELEDLDETRGLVERALAPQPSTVEPRKPMTEDLIGAGHPFSCVCRTCAKPTVEPAREERPECHVVYRSRAKCSLPAGHDGEHRGQGYSWANHCEPAARPTAEEKPEPFKIRCAWCGREPHDEAAVRCIQANARDSDGQVKYWQARAEAAEKSLETANGLLARAAGALGLVDSVSANEAREAIRAHLSLKGAK